MEYRLSFRGTGKEFFGIWIVNTLLKIVTLGFYTAWAKVRRRRYFAGNTMLSNEPFEYRADPKALFRGWVIAVVALLIYMIAGRYSPILGMGIGVAIACAVPWVIVKSRIFNSRNLAHRNIRFDFRPNYGEAYIVYLGLLLLVPVTLGIILPYVVYRQKRFQVENSLYGATPFRFTAEPKDFYRLFLNVLLWAAGIVAALIVGFAIFAKGFSPLEGDRQKLLLAFIPLLIILPLYLFAGVYVATAIANLTWSRTELGDIRFTSSLNPLTMVWLYLSGFVAVVFSVGLLYPWAAVRLTRYRFDRLTVHTAEDMEKFIAGMPAPAEGAGGEEIGDLFGLDMDIAF